jgi:restriction system protein
VARRKKQKSAFDTIFGTPQERARSRRQAKAREANSQREARARARRIRADARRRDAEARRQRAELKRATAAARKADKQSKKALATRQTADAEKDLRELQNTLTHTLGVDDAVDWNALIRRISVPDDKPEPTEFMEVPPPPDSSDSKYMPKVGFFALFSARLRERASQEAQALLQRDTSAWQEIKQAIESENTSSTEFHLDQVAAWEAEVERCCREVQELRAIEKTYLENEAEAVVQYCEIVLTNSRYSSDFPQQFELEYQSDSNVLLVDYLLPDIAVVPTLKKVRYVASTDTFKESFLSQSAIKKVYDDLVYQVALRTIHELYEADMARALASVVFNGWVKTVDKATGHDTAICVLSVDVAKDDFSAIHLGRVDPESCVKALNAVSKARPSRESPIEPALTSGRQGCFVLNNAPGDEFANTQKAEGF